MRIGKIAAMAVMAGLGAGALIKRNISPSNESPNGNTGLRGRLEDKIDSRNRDKTLAEYGIKVHELPVAWPKNDRRDNYIAKTLNSLFVEKVKNGFSKEDIDYFIDVFKELNIPKKTKNYYLELYVVNFKLFVGIEAAHYVLDKLKGK